MKYVIIGTAGHVDHGKSALIKALTGTDTDRLKEEKARGISIDLGFAAMDLSPETIAGIVDVPGHERFLKNMIAGTGGIDVAMLVIAADEGVMPQTREHLAMLHFYGIEHGVVVINKVDKVDADWLELVEEDVSELLAGTFLAAAPRCRVSAVTGAGLDVLKSSLLKAAEAVTVRDSRAPFRLWIDRVFTVKGYGTVVTGSVLSGRACVGDALTLYPLRQQVRVRGVESHGHKVEAVYAGQRAALNLAGTPASEITRGMFLSHNDYGQVSEAWDVRVMLDQPVESGTRIRLHLGTGEFLGRLHAFKEDNPQYRRFIAEEPVAAGAGDRGIIRLYSPQTLLGGVMLIAPCKQARRISEEREILAQALLTHDTEQVIYGILAENTGLMSEGEVKRQAGYFTASQVEQSLEALQIAKKIIMLDQFFLAIRSLKLLTRQCTALLEAFHREQPDRAGVSGEIVRQKLGLTEKAFDKLAALWSKEGTLTINDGELALPAHANKYQAWSLNVMKASEQALTEPGFLTIDASILGEKLKLLPEEAKIAFHMLLSKGVVVQVDSVYIHQTTIQKAVRLLQHYFRDNEELTVSQLRTMLNTSRKVALPLLEYFDALKYTVRSGDARRPGAALSSLSQSEAGDF